MLPDTILYDSLSERPLPKWLTDQRDGLNYYQPEVLVMKDDQTLNLAIVLTGIVIVLVILFLTIYIVRKYKIRL